MLRVLFDGSWGVLRSDYIPLGMTYDQYARGLQKADRVTRLSTVLAVAAPTLCMALAMIAGAVLFPGGGLGLGPIGMLGVWFAVCVGGPAGWVVCWRRHRDEVARAAAVGSMDEFMEQRGFVRHPLLLWQRQRRGGGGH